MTRKGPRDPFTMDLFSGWVPPRVAVGFEPGQIKGSRLSSRISRAIARALKDCGKDRTTVAGLMSERLGHKVTIAMLEAYASEAKVDHNITVERFVALVHATGKTELLGFLADDFGLAVVDRKYQNVIELALIEDHERMVLERKRALQLQVRRQVRGSK